MSEQPSQQADEAVDLVSSLVEGVFDRLTPLLAATERLVTGPAGITGADLDLLRPVTLEALGGVVIGAGFVAAPDVLRDQRFGIEWWSAPDGGPAERLQISLDPASEYFLDYTRQSWFTVPRDTGRRHITGPYVDYLCTDEYTLTFTVPVHGPGGLAGVVGADVYVREFELLMLPRLRAVGGRAALVNAQGRVIVSTSARQATGSLIREPNVPDWWSSGAEPARRGATLLRRCGDTPIALLTTG